jgi:Uma2 family endonuclease
MSPTGGGHGRVAGNLHIALGIWVVPRKLGSVLAAETGFQLGPGTVLAGDVAYVRAGQEPAHGSASWERYWQLAPDLVGEIASPGQRANELEAKARAWLNAGVRLVWLIWPRRHEVDVWRLDSLGASHQLATLKPNEALDGLDVLPGFSYPLAELFA